MCLRPTRCDETRWDTPSRSLTWWSVVLNQICHPCWSLCLWLFCSGWSVACPYPSWKWSAKILEVKALNIKPLGWNPISKSVACMSCPTVYQTQYSSIIGWEENIKADVYLACVLFKNWWKQCTQYVSQDHVKCKNTGYFSKNRYV